jgi:hypothetical protein
MTLCGYKLRRFPSKHSQEAHRFGDLKDIVVRTKVLQVRHPAVEMFALLGW